MAEIEGAGNTVQLVPDVILSMIEEYGFLDDLKSVLSFRLVSRIWNESLRHLVGPKTVTVLSDENLSAFEKFLSSDASAEFRVPIIHSVILNIRCDFERSLALRISGSSETVYLKKALDAFARLPISFRSQLLCFKLKFEAGITDYCRTESLQRTNTWIHWRHEFFRKYKIPVPTETHRAVPLHISVNFLRSCSVLKQLSLQAFDMELPSDFWESFKNTISSNGLNESIDELFFEDERRFDRKIKIKHDFSHLYDCKLQLKKLGLGIPYSMSLSREKREIFRFFIQQSDSLEYLQLPRRERLNSSFKFGKYCAEEGGNLLSHSSSLVKIHLESFYIMMDHYHYWSHRIKSLVLKQLECFLSMHLFQIFPNLNSLEIEHSYFWSRTRTLPDIFTYGTALKKLSIQFRFKIVDERRLSRHDNTYEPRRDNSDTPRRRAHSRPIKADCFILGQKPRHCKRFQSGQLVCDDTTEFHVPSQPSITNLHQLEHLSLGGYFTEMTLWAGIKTLTQLKELNLKTQYFIHPRTLLKLESHLTQLQTWNYTKLAELKYGHGYREMYKCFRILPDILSLAKIHVWKFKDDDVEKKVVTSEEFDDMDLSYAGTRDMIVPEGFWPEPETESDLEIELSNSESEDE